MEKVEIYSTELIEIDKERWLEMCLQEELKNLRNRCSSKWCEGLIITFERIRDRSRLEGICNENRKKEWEEKLAREVKIK